MLIFNPDKHIIGSLCKKEPLLHDYNNTGTSIRRKAHWKTAKGERRPSPGECVLCEKTRQANDYEKNKDKIQKRHKQWQQENQEQLKNSSERLVITQMKNLLSLMGGYENIAKLLVQV